MPTFFRRAAALRSAALTILLIPSGAVAAVRDVPGTHATVAAALAASVSGDTVRVAEGTYAASTNGETFPLVVGDGIVLEGAGIGLSVLDAEADSAQVVRMEGSLGGRVTGFTITGGRAVRGAGVFVAAGSPEVDGNLIHGNGASSAGAGLFALGGASPWVHHNVFWENFDTVPGDAVDPHGLLFQVDAAGIVEHNLIGRTDGNGLLTSGSASPSVRHNLFLENGDAGPPARGRGICWLSDAPADVFHNLFHANTIAALLWPAAGTNFSGTSANDVDPADDVYGNVDGDPLLANPSMLEFSLTPGSPAVDAGDPSFPLDPDGTPPDLGPFFLDQSTVDAPRADPARWAAASPNPFRTETSLTWTADGPARVVIFDVRGSHVRDLSPGGRDRATWDGRDDAGRAVPSGVYFARVESAERVTSVPLLRLR